MMSENGEDDLKSDWVIVTQDMVDLFSTATLDPDPLHIDPDFAANGPFGKPIAFGFLTISLLTHLLHNAVGDAPIDDLRNGYALNYGFDRIRLISPVLVDSRVRGVFRRESSKQDDLGRVLTRWTVRVDVEGQERPALAAIWLTMWVPPSA